MQLTRKVIGSALNDFEQYFTDAFRSHVPLLDGVLRYITRQRGKQLRPMFVLLSASLGGAVNERSHRAALFVEMLHTSSLVHDDLVDDSMERRGAFSINALWKSRTAVLVGDNLFTKSILLLLDHGDHQILKIFSDSIRQVIEGELSQMEKSRKLNLNEAVYFDIIKGKTATLLAAACAAGAASTLPDDQHINRLYQFGEKAGIAFQIKDDLFDYGEADIGKPTGNDIKEKKITLPLIYTLNNCSAPLKRELINIIKHHNTDKEMVHYVVEQVRKAGGIQYAEEKMMLYRTDALELLHAFPESEVRAALEELVNYITDRSY